MMESQKVCHKNMGDGIADHGESMPAIIKNNNNHEKIWLIKEKMMTYMKNNKLESKRYEKETKGK